MNYPHKVTESSFWATWKFWCPVAQNYVPADRYDYCPKCGKKVKR